MLRDDPSVVRVVLTGYSAMGLAGPVNEYDLLIILTGRPNKGADSVRLRRMLPGALPLAVSVMGEDEFEETKDLVGTFAYPAHKHGTVLYDAIPRG